MLLNTTMSLKLYCQSMYIDYDIKVHTPGEFSAYSITSTASNVSMQFDENHGTTQYLMRKLHNV